MAGIVKLSVRTLVEYAYRSGSIETGFRSAVRLSEGTRAHQMVQSRYKDTDRKEVYLETEIGHGELIFSIEGRCDGLLLPEDDGGDVTIDEIKSTTGNPGLLAEGDYPVHWAQAVCYAYMYARIHGLDRMRVQLTYVQVVTGELKRFERVTAYDELEAAVSEMVKRFAPYAAFLHDHRQRRDRSIKNLPFPFDRYREGQRTFAGAVYKTIAEGARLFAKAPTGTGKTISTLFPSVKAVGEGLLQRIFYLTAKTTTRTAAEEAFALMERNGLRMQIVTLTAKDKICFKEEMRCSKEHCEFSDGYYDRINEAVLDLLSHETMMTRAVIERYARKHRVCPFEFSLDAAYAADGMICDYNYLFDPRVSLKRLSEETKRQTVLLVDESHNLVDRARDMFSAEITKAPYVALKREYKERNPALHAAVKAVNDYFIAYRKAAAGKEAVTRELPGELLALVESFAVEAERELAGAGARGAGSDPDLLDAYFAAQSFIRTAGFYDERFVTVAEAGRNDVRVRLFCLDPSLLLRQMGKGYRSQVFFSATLSPLSYYMDLLGGSGDDYTVSIPTPFAREQLEVRIQPLSTRYRDREDTRERLAATIRGILEERPGNYLIFFPSFDYMNAVYERFAEYGTDSSIGTLVQNPGMPEEERESFLAAFREDNAEPFAGFAVLGGIFSEGIDLAGDRLTGVVVVGVGLPQISLERNIIRDYFNSVGKDGYDYAYVYPGMNKVMQAAGRLIRTETDRGLLLLVDDRFLQPKYQALLPAEWKGFTVVR